MGHFGQSFFHTHKQTVMVSDIVTDSEPTGSADPNHEMHPSRQWEGKIKECNTFKPLTRLWLL
jgi:hypothetical protein